MSLGAGDLSLRVDEVAEVATGIRSLVLRPAAGVELSPYVPGSHLVIECGGRRNAYSLTGSGNLPEAYTISVLLRPDGQGGSDWMHRLEPGRILRCSRPRDAFAPVVAARHHLLIAGGIGITPFLSHLRAARLWRRSATLLYSVGGTGPVPHLRELEALTDGRLRVLRNRGAMRQAMAQALRIQPLGTHLYICGPDGLMDTALTLARDCGWPEERCHAERFGGVETGEGMPFTVKLRRSDRVIDVPSNVSLLDALAAAGVAWPSMCRRGVCGECRMGGAEGAILHRDLVLSAAERLSQSCLMPCVSRAEGVLTLDL